MGIGSEEKMTQKIALTFRVSDEVLAVIDRRAEAEFIKRAAAASMILDEAVARDTGAEPSKSATLKEKSAAVDLEMKEMRLAQLRKEVLTVNQAVGVVREVFGEMKTEGHTLMDDFAREFNLDAEVLRRRFDEAMSGPMTVEREAYQRLADDFAGEPLPS